MLDVYDALSASACRHDLKPLNVGLIRKISNIEGRKLLKSTYSAN